MIPQVVLVGVGRLEPSLRAALAVQAVPAAVARNEDDAMEIAARAPIRCVFAGARGAPHDQALERWLRCVGFSGPLVLLQGNEDVAQLVPRLLAAPPPQAGDADEDFEMLRREFRQTLATQRDEAEQALRRLDWPSLEALAHAVKGTAGSFGYGQLTEPAAALEQALMAQRLGEAPALARRLLHAMDTAL